MSLLQQLSVIQTAGGVIPGAMVPVVLVGKQG